MARQLGFLETEVLPAGEDGILRLRGDRDGAPTPRDDELSGGIERGRLGNFLGDALDAVLGRAHHETPPRARTCAMPSLTSAASRRPGSGASMCSTVRAVPGLG